MKKSTRDILILTTGVLLVIIVYKSFYSLMPKRYSISHRTSVIYSRTGSSVQAEFMYKGKLYTVLSAAYPDSNSSYEKYRQTTYLVEFLEDYPSRGRVITESIVPNNLDVPYNGWDTIPKQIKIVSE